MNKTSFVKELEANIRSFFESEWGWDFSPFDKALYEQVEKDNSLILCYSYWDDGENCSVVTHDELRGIANDILSRPEDESYRVIVFDCTGQAYEIEVAQIELRPW